MLNGIWLIYLNVFFSESVKNLHFLVASEVADLTTYNEACVCSIYLGPPTHPSLVNADVVWFPCPFKKARYVKFLMIFPVSSGILGVTEIELFGYWDLLFVGILATFQYYHCNINHHQKNTLAGFWRFLLITIRNNIYYVPLLISMIYILYIYHAIIKTFRSPKEHFSIVVSIRLYDSDRHTIHITSNITHYRYLSTFPFLKQLRPDSLNDYRRNPLVPIIKHHIIDRLYGLTNLEL